MNINKIIIWGHELHDHTHSYIHNAFFKSFKYLGYETYWLNDSLPKDVDPNNSLYIVHGITSKNLPLNKTSLYLSHNIEWKHTFDENHRIPSNHNYLNLGINIENIIGVPVNNIIGLQVLTNTCPLFSENIYQVFDNFNNTIYISWATDILPYQIDKNIKFIENQNFNCDNRDVCFIGMSTEPWDTVNDYCKKHGYNYINYGGRFDRNCDLNKSVEENMTLIQNSFIAPTIQTEWQIENSYFPCRIFKNISYGKMGVTNNKFVNDLFKGQLIYDQDINKLMDKASDFELNNQDKKRILKQLMINVRDNHTYINRCHYILDCVKDKIVLNNLNYLENCKEYLENAINYYFFKDKQIKFFGRVPLSRYHTFKYCYENLSCNPLIIELGTSRSFVDGRFEGCCSNDPIYWEKNNPDKWDWSAGLFTKVFSKLCPTGKLITVDNISTHIEISKIINEEAKNIEYYVNESVEFLREFQEKADLIYIDTGDLVPVEDIAELHLKEVKMIVEKDLLAKEGMILIDDIKSVLVNQEDTSEYGIGKYAIPYLLENGFKIEMYEYQIILRKL